MSELVKQLRHLAELGDHSLGDDQADCSDALRKAADEIEKLEAKMAIIRDLSSGYAVCPNDVQAIYATRPERKSLYLKHSWHSFTFACSNWWFIASGGLRRKRKS